MFSFDMDQNKCFLVHPARLCTGIKFVPSVTNDCSSRTTDSAQAVARNMEYRATQQSPQMPKAEPGKTSQQKVLQDVQQMEHQASNRHPVLPFAAFVKAIVVTGRSGLLYQYVLALAAI